MIFKGAGTIIYDSVYNKILIVRGYEKYSLPKGHIKTNESLYSCALRETYEETGFQIIIPNDPKTMIIQNYIYFFIQFDCGSTCNVKPLDQHEILFAEWVDPKKCIDILDECNIGLKYLLVHWNFFIDLQT